jgi:membrane protein YqaA with SNARE-associated domain
VPETVCFGAERRFCVLSIRGSSSCGFWFIGGNLLMNDNKSKITEWKAKGYWDWLKHQIIEIKDNFSNILAVILPVIAIVFLIVTIGLCLCSGVIAFYWFNVDFWYSSLIEAIGLACSFFVITYIFYWHDKDSVVYTHIDDASSSANSLEAS